MKREDGVLPDGWAHTTLSQILDDIQPGFASGKHSSTGSGLPHLRPMNITRNGRVDLCDLRLISRALADKPTRHLRRGDVLFNNTNSLELVGRTALFEGEDEPAFSNHMTRLRVKNEIIEPAFVARFLHGRWQAGDFQRLANNHVSQASINRGVLGDLPVALPPLAEQRRIAKRLDEIEDRRASMDDHLQAARTWLKRLRKSVPTEACSGRLTAEWRVNNEPDSLAEALEKKRKSIRTHLGDKEVESQPMDTGALPDIPENWCWALLPELGEMGRGKSRHRPRNDPRLYGGDVPFIQTGDIARANGRVEHHTQTYNEEGLAQSRLWPAGTVCMTIAANIAQSAILSYPACFPDSVVGLVTDPCVALPEYVELFIRTARDDLAAYAPATAQANINLAILGRVAVPLPPVEEQAEILRLAHLMLAASDSIEAQLEYVNTVLGEATRSTFAKAFRGELVPTEAELAAEEERDYETAEELLARVADS